MRTPLAGRWCLVLGASSGMGAATARAMARAGAHVIGVHFDTAEGREKTAVLVEELRSYGGRVHFENVNAASARARAEVVPRIVELVGDEGVRVLLHSLAFGTLVPFLGSDERPGITERQMDMTLSVMAHSLVYWTQDLYAAGALRPGSKVFAMTSAGDVKVSPNYGAVSAAKSALQAHVRQLAVELAPSGVAVNAVRAGVTVTPSLERIPEHRELVERAGAANPHGRLTRPDDVADAIVAFSEPESSWVTGNILGVDGGEVLTS